MYFLKKTSEGTGKGRIVAKLINIGFGNVVNSDKIIAVVSPEAAPVSVWCSVQRESNRIIDATQEDARKQCSSPEKNLSSFRLCSRKRSAVDSTGGWETEKERGGI